MLLPGGWQHGGMHVAAYCSCGAWLYRASAQQKVNLGWQRSEMDGRGQSLAICVSLMLGSRASWQLAGMPQRCEWVRIMNSCTQQVWQCHGMKGLSLRCRRDEVQPAVKRPCRL